jgi:predicted HicB family RNase H-like nuclease
MGRPKRGEGLLNTNFTFRMSAEMREMLARAAKERGISMAHEVTRRIEQTLTADVVREAIREELRSKPRVRVPAVSTYRETVN